MLTEEAGRGAMLLDGRTSGDALAPNNLDAIKEARFPKKVGERFDAIYAELGL